MQTQQNQRLLSMVRFEYDGYLNANYSQESVGAVVNNMLDNVLSFVPNVLHSINHFKQSFFDDTQAIKLNREHRNFIKDIEKRSYADTRLLKAFTPEGMNKTYLEYVTALMSSPVFCLTTEQDTLNRFSLMLARLVNNKEESKSIDTSFVDHLKKRAGERDAMLAKIGECFIKGSSATETTLGAVVHRSADLEPVFVGLEKMINEINRVNRNAMMKTVDECVRMLEILMRKIKLGEYPDISPEMINVLSEGTYHMASEVEFFASTHYRVFELNTSVSDTIAFIHNIVK